MQAVVRPPNPLQAGHSPAAAVDLADPLGRAVGRNVDENHLQPYGIECCVQQLGSFQDLPPQHEKAAHWIGNVGFPRGRKPVRDRRRDRWVGRSHAKMSALAVDHPGFERRAAE